MDQVTTARKRAEASWRNSLAAMSALLGLPWTAAAALLWLGGVGLSALPQDTPRPFVILAATTLSAVVLGFAVGRILVARDVVRRLLGAPGPDLSDTTDEERLAVPAAMLEPDHAVSVPHLDRILSGSVDTRSPSDTELRRMRRRGAAITGTAVIALGFFVLSLLAFLAPQPGGVAELARRLTAAAAIGPIGVNAAVLWAVQQLGLLTIARRVIEAQGILDRGTLSDDGSPLTVLRRLDSRIVVNLRAFPRRLAPRRNHLVWAANDRAPALFVGAWAFTVTGPLVTMIAAVLAFTAPR